MAETASSAAEAALENQKIGGLQLRVAALCTLVQICDGYDLNSVAWAVPSLIRSWHLAPAMFTTAFLWSSIGIMVGALSAGPIGDRFGRRPLLLGSLTIFGIASLLTASAGSLETLTLWRFFTGIGIGGGFSGAAALTGDYTPHRLRATMIMASFTGAPAGGFIGGQLVAVLLRALRLAGDLRRGRRVPAASWWRHWPCGCPSRRASWPRGKTCRSVTLTLLQRLDIEPTRSGPVDVAQGNPVAMLFSEGYALQTVLLWIVYFCSLMNLFLFAYWMPTVLNLIGMTPSEAVFASSLQGLRRRCSRCCISALAIDRMGPERTLALHYALGAVFIAVIALIALPYALLLLMTFPGRDDDHRQPDRRQRHLRQAVSGAHAHEWPGLGARHRAARRHRRADTGWLPAVARPRADAHLPQRLPVRADRGGGHRAAGVSWQPRRRREHRGGYELTA